MSQTPTPSGQAQDERAAFEALTDDEIDVLQEAYDCYGDCDAPRIHDFARAVEAAVNNRWNARASMAGPAPLADDLRPALMAMARCDTITDAHRVLIGRVIGRLSPTSPIGGPTGREGCDYVTEPGALCRKCWRVHAATPPEPTAGNEPAALAALRELVRLQDQYMPDAAPHEWANAWEAARAALSGAAQPEREGCAQMSHDVDWAEFMRWKAKRDEDNRQRGDFWLSHEGRAIIRKTWDDPEDGAIPLPLLNHIERLEAAASASREAAQAETITVQEAWEAAGGNPGIKATRKVLLAALRQLDEVCDEAAQAPVGAVPAGWRIRRLDAKPFNGIEVIAPNGASSAAYSHARNPENVLFMLADALLTQAPESKDAQP